MSHRIEISAHAVEVTGPRTPALDALTTNYGSYRRGTYSFPKSAEQRVREALNTTTPATAPPPGQATGWSNAARRRAGHTTGSHPLGAVAHRGGGYTEYHDDLTGDGTVQIWDES